MPHRNTQIRVTEPTMSNGVWHLAAFEWVSAAVFTHHEIEDSVISWVNLQIIEKTALRVRYDDWLETMPAVAKTQEQLTFYECLHFINDTQELHARARGWFALSDDEAATERMLALVNVEKIEHMLPMYWVLPRPLDHEAHVERFVRGGVLMDSNLAHREVWWRLPAAEREDNTPSFLRPGTADNDINPDFTTGPLRYRVRPHWDVSLTDWRGVYGSMSDGTTDAALLSFDPAQAVIVPADNRPLRDIIMPLPTNTGDGSGPPSAPADTGPTGDT